MYLASDHLFTLTQQEAICFSYDGKAVFVTSEQRPAPLIRIDLDKRDSQK